MELCTPRALSNVPLRPQKPLVRIQAQSTTHFPLSIRQNRLHSAGLQCRKNTFLRSATSEETSTESTPYVINEPDGGIIVEDTQSVEKKEDYDAQPDAEAPQGDSLVDNPMQLFSFLENLDVKFDYEETYSILVFGGGATVAVWLAAAVIGAIDSIPVLPKMLELVGLGYTLWFSTRYLIFKKNRDELFAKVEQIKQQVLGSADD